MGADAAGPYSFQEGKTYQVPINYYLEEPSEDGKQLVLKPLSANFRRQKWNEQIMPVTDMRGHEHEFRLDKQGFELLQGVDLKETTYDDDERIKTVVYDEVKDLVKKQTGASFVSIYNHVVRRNPHQDHVDIVNNEKIDGEDIVNIRSPTVLAHVDHSYKDAKAVLEGVPDAAQTAHRGKNTRWAIINFWKPLKTITREPLVMCDARTVAERDLRPVIYRITYDNPYAQKQGQTDKLLVDNEIWYIGHNPDHRWYYPKGMKPDEAFLFKIFDTKLDGTAQRTPHTAIQTPHDHGAPRESIEVRCLVFWEDEPLVGREKEFASCGIPSWEQTAQKDETEQKEAEKKDDALQDAAHKD